MLSIGQKHDQTMCMYTIEANDENGLANISLFIDDFSF